QFGGEWFHTARWPAHLDLTGKRVAVIGTGCTGYQLIPEVVKEAEHVFVFQRTPNWVYEAPGYLAPYPDQVNWMDRNFPKVSLATVYNTLAALVRVGLLRELRPPHTGRTVYDDNVAEHYHFLDDRTGRLYDVDPARVAVTPRLGAGFSVRRVDVLLRGTKE
ncbi:MAG: transcriptional repressor, partial [Elusimicrobia bacterium]|nr:transcriptional repressor [Elusimicrobiota bacterium]